MINGLTVFFPYICKGSSSIGTSVNSQFLAAFSAAAGKRSYQYPDSEESDPGVFFFFLVNLHLFLFYWAFMLLLFSRSLFLSVSQVGLLDCCSWVKKSINEDLISYHWKSEKWILWYPAFQMLAFAVGGIFLYKKEEILYGFSCDLLKMS